MIFSENQYPLFRIMLQRLKVGAGLSHDGSDRPPATSTYRAGSWTPITCASQTAVAEGTTGVRQRVPMTEIRDPIKAYWGA
jgi:hypothetical protein